MMKLKFPLRVGLLALSAMVLFSCTKDEMTTDSEVLESTALKVASPSSDVIPNQYIVMLKKDATVDFNETKIRGKALGLLRKTGMDAEVRNVYSHVFSGFAMKLNKGQLKKLEDDPAVLRVMPDVKVSLPPIIAAKKPDNPGNGGGGGGTTGQTTPWGITRVGGAADGTGKTAWIIDSGIDLDHPDLNGDAGRSVSFVAGDASPEDANGHGTHVAGTVAALDNNEGVVGVAAGASVVSLRVLGSDGTGDFSWTIDALDHVVQNGSNGDVVNMSLGPKTPYTDAAVVTATQAVGQAGIKVAIAAGNSYDDAALYSPANANGNNIYTISAMAEGDYFAYFSNYGSPVDYIAPGYQVESTWLNGGYNTISGTSMASPHAAGVLLLGNPSSDGTASDAYWEVKGQSATGNYSGTDIFRRSAFRPDPDNVDEPIIVR
ncbi:S8 family serine peptidase [Maribacter algicola]|uniref:S8 family serine peptidase n=1 Tax=Meishania litoralis TaxID=3434685 RepID=A0ACC7LQT6_9FLAO